jgi:hypothetical protein
LRVVVLLKPLAVPLIVTANVPVVATLLADSVKVLVPVVMAGLKDTLTPPGRPEADRLTVPVKPFCGAMVTVLVPPVPCKTLRLFGEAERE